MTQQKRLQKEEDTAYRWMRNNPDKFAAEAAKSFPVVVKPGVPIIKLDTSYVVLRDTLIKDSVVYITKDSIAYVNRTVHIVDTIPDRALADAAMALKLKADRDLAKALQREETLQAQKKKLTNIIIALSVAILIFVVGAIVKFWVKIKTFFITKGLNGT